MSARAWHFEERTLVLEVRVQPRASRDEVVGIVDGRVRIRVSAPPVGDAANDRLKAFLAREFGVSRGRARILAGHKAKDKRLAIDAPGRIPRWLKEKNRRQKAGGLKLSSGTASR